MMSRIIHQRKKCIGCSYCVEIAPAFWKMNERDGRCDLIGSDGRNGQFILEIFEDELRLNQRVSELCPAKCIRIE
ncbi:ferredoxin [Ancylomarina longa]|uniref:Ferredoxin n=1 Tax=Ancylomarina longa TaxID=2487017 RepID=A0A434AV52_9BACT|nr:ferredoxin [Ancylomarina longa]